MSIQEQARTGFGLTFRLWPVVQLLTALSPHFLAAAGLAPNIESGGS